MNIKDNSIVGTIIDYANIKFGMEIKPEEITQQLKDMSFSDTLRLVDAIKTENDELFSSLVDLSALSEAGGYGTAATSQPSVAGTRQQNTQAQQSIRSDKLAVAKASQTPTGARTVAGSAKQPTAVPRRPDQTDPAQDQAAQTATQAAQNSQEIDRLKQLIKGTR
jgi:hypothetical protein